MNSIPKVRVSHSARPPAERVAAHARAALCSLSPSAAAGAPLSGWSGLFCAPRSAQNEPADGCQNETASGPENAAESLVELDVEELELYSVADSDQGRDAERAANQTHYEKCAANSGCGRLRSFFGYGHWKHALAIELPLTCERRTSDYRTRPAFAHRSVGGAAC